MDKKADTSKLGDSEVPPLSLVNETDSDSDEEMETRGSAPATYALTIGIDKYRGARTHPEGDSPSRLIFNDLSGCVADANDVANFLTGTLRVPKTNVKNLRNEGATAANITAAFESLASDKSIPKGSAIFIYYAGHGGETSPPEGWPSPSEKIQIIIPYDFDPGSGPHPIIKNVLSDIKLNQLLENIANNKGNNIIVIFDSCHSGSATRDAIEPGVVARSIQLKEGSRLSNDTLTEFHGATIPTKYNNKGLASHVLLAACNEAQKAYEGNRRGRFTSALMELLRSQDLKRLTYSDIIRRFPKLKNDQTPQCEGLNQNRIFLRNRITCREPIPYKVTHWEGNTSNKYSIDAGEAHGVVINAEFTVYDTENCTKELGRLVVFEVLGFQSRLRPVGDARFFKPPAFALQSRPGDVQRIRLLFDESSGALTDIRKKMCERGWFKAYFQVVKREEDEPQIVVTGTWKEAHFVIPVTDKVCRDVGFKVISHDPLPKDEQTIKTVLLGVSHFFWNLYRKPSQAAKDPSDHSVDWLQFGCYELVEGAISGADSMVMKPIGGNLFVNGDIQIAIGEEKPYGFCIKNNSHRALFVSVFYFNMRDFSIDPFYEPPVAANKGHTPSLPAHGHLTIGYGSSVSPPRAFHLQEGDDVDVGYVKLFLSTEYVDYSPMKQLSPFRSEREQKEWKPKSQFWDTRCIPIIQRRK